MSGASSDHYPPSPKHDTWRFPQKIRVYGEEIDEHFEHLFPGMETCVFHEILSDLVHIDISIKSPNSRHPYYVLFTSGMSDFPMPVTEKKLQKNRKDWERAELFMYLPKNFPMEHAKSEGILLHDVPEEEAWPLHWLKFLAKFPHEYRTWLGPDHTIANGPDYAPLGPNTRQGGSIFLQMFDERGQMVTADDTIINLYCVIPLYREEIEYKVSHNRQEWEQLLKPLPVMVDLQRHPLC